jgi:uncharacterized protein (DUF1501 family)
VATRRDFLTRGLGLVGLSATLPNFIVRSALAGEKNAGERIVVSLLLTGGPDGLSLAPPFRNDDYRRHRKTLAIAESDVIKLNDDIGLHPRLAGFRTLIDECRGAVVLGTGYPNFNLSHFVGRDIWESATTRDESGKPGATGWLGRYLDQVCRDPDPTLNVAVGPGRLPLIITGKNHPGVSFESSDSFRFSGVKSPAAEALYARLNSTGPAARADDLQYVRQTAVNANAASQSVRELADRYETPVEYPDTQFGNSVRTIAGLIGGGLKARVYYAAQGIAVFGGYDTHADQIRRLEQLLDELSQAITAFYRDLDRQGNSHRVLTFTFSEFGRRVQENFSGGTDHGLAQPMFIFGEGVNAGVHGKQPSLTDMDERGNLKMEIDFRSVYACILERWLGVPSAPLLGAEYPLLECIS